MSVTRVIHIIKSRGIYGFWKFLMTRIYRSSSENVYQKTSKSIASNKCLIGCTQEYDFSIIDKTNYKKAKYKRLIDSIDYGEIAEYIAGIERDSLLFLISNSDEQVLHTSFVQFRSRYKKLIQEDNHVPLIGNCWTDRNYRGKGFYPYTISAVADEMFRRNYQRVIVSCASDNIPSIKGIEKSDFELVNRIRSYILFNKFVIQLSTNKVRVTKKVFLF
ncbi:MAG: GNAT family N-acetyltransferase [Colwellia sp.]|nr:GNAT family N-acetyltransferase [Colwellia sp.]